MNALICANEVKKFQAVKETHYLINTKKEKKGGKSKTTKLKQEDKWIKRNEIHGGESGTLGMKGSQRKTLMMQINYKNTARISEAISSELFSLTSFYLYVVQNYPTQLHLVCPPLTIVAISSSKKSIFFTARHHKLLVFAQFTPYKTFNRDVEEYFFSFSFFNVQSRQK